MLFFKDWQRSSETSYIRSWNDANRINMKSIAFFIWSLPSIYCTYSVGILFQSENWKSASIKNIVIEPVMKLVCDIYVSRIKEKILYAACYIIMVSGTLLSSVETMHEIIYFIKVNVNRLNWKHFIYRIFQLTKI